MGWSPNLSHDAATPIVLADARQAAFGLLLWLGGIVLALLAGTALLVFVRRRMKRSPALENRGFTLDDIRGMRARGEISEIEYDTLRRRIVGLGASPDANLTKE